MVGGTAGGGSSSTGAERAEAGGALGSSSPRCDRAPLNSRIPLPRDLPISGSRFGPKMSTASAWQRPGRPGTRLVQTVGRVAWGARPATGKPAWRGTCPPARFSTVLDGPASEEVGDRPLRGPAHARYPRSEEHRDGAQSRNSGTYVGVPQLVRHDRFKSSEVPGGRFGLGPGRCHGDVSWRPVTHP